MSLAGAITLSSLELTRFFFAMVLILFTAHSFGFLFYEAKLPRVIGEIFGGLVLGPTFLGFVAPGAESWVFGAFLAGIAIGMMPEEVFALAKSQVKSISLAVFTPVYFAVVGLKIVTSIPVISKIFIDLKIMNTRFAKIVLAIATVEDVIQFGALAIATGVGASASASISLIGYTAFVTVAFFGAALLVLPRLIRYTIRSRFDVLIKYHPSRYALFLCFSMVALASLLNVNIVFGAFLAGIAIGMMPEEVFALAKSQVKSISLAVFTPVYFAVVGLKIATALKGGGALVVGKLIKQKRLPSFNLAIALNARGGPGIVLATVAFDMGLISETFFVALVLTAIVTSLIAGFWLRYVKKKGWELL